MTATAATLRELHRLRRHAKNLKDEIDRLPRLVQSQEKKVKLQEQVQKQTHDKITKLKVNLREKEGKLKDEHQLVGKYEKQRNEATNKKEYDAFTIEIAHAKETCQKLEEEILALMEESDQLNARLPDIDTTLQQAKKDLSQSDQIQKERHGSLSAELTKAMQEIKGVEVNLPDDLRQQYDRLVQHMGEDAMSALNGRTCTACYTAITAQMYNNLVVGLFVLCKNCGRILYLPEQETAKT
jgi:predicted  nucleic acid-binding Zn-ribbon protein